MTHLIIDDEEAYNLAQELAAEGETNPSALVLDLLRNERSRRQRPVRTQAQYDYWRKIAQNNRASLTHPVHSSEVDAFLYDERGLPK